MKLTYDIHRVRPYINWIYFYHAWQLKPEAEQQRIREEAELLLDVFENRYHTFAVCLVTDAHAEGDDIVLADGARLPLLRQQSGQPCLCLSDFVSPRADRVALFATSVDASMVTDAAGDPYQHMMAQLLADRLAEATAELLHLEVRTRYWGYAPDEQLTVDELHQERFQGIRPAVGYPSLPDTSLNFVLDRLLGMGQIGIVLTESGAMRPHASVSGLMLSHPAARYFSVGKIGADQLADYACRRGLPVETIRKFLAANL